MNSDSKIFYLMWIRGGYLYYSFFILFWIVAIVYWLPIYTIVIALSVQILMIEVFGLKIEVHKDKLIIRKIFSKEKTISFDLIKNVTKGQREFFGQIGVWRDSLIIPYVEPSGYKCEFTDLYNEEMHICIDSYFSAYNKKKDSMA